MKKRSSLVISILLLAFGGFSIFYGIDLARSNSANWPSLPGKIASSWVQATYGEDTDDYYVAVTYTYNTGGADYSSSFNTSSRTFESDAQADLVNYHPGSEITIYYDPKDPSRSTTSPGEMEFTGVIGIIMGIVFLGMGGNGIRAYFVGKKSPVQAAPAPTVESPAE
jgi:hypothetical protein